MKHLTINFGGFYESLHSDFIDNEIEQYFSDESGEPTEQHDVNYSHLCKIYINEYASALNELINDEYNINITFHNISLYSPKYYNFETDTIETNISNESFNKLVKLFINDYSFIDFVNKTSAGYDGFHSFYEGIEAVKKDDTILVQYIFNYILSDNTESIFDYLDSNYAYETIFNAIELINHKQAA